MSITIVGTAKTRTGFISPPLLFKFQNRNSLFFSSPTTTSFSRFFTSIKQRKIQPNFTTSLGKDYNIKIFAKSKNHFQIHLNEEKFSFFITQRRKYTTKTDKGGGPAPSSSPHLLLTFQNYWRESKLLYLLLFSLLLLFLLCIYFIFKQNSSY